MDNSSILGPLNKSQREAVTAPAANILVLAGAGSGKTRVLVHRIAWYIKETNARPHEILAVTFTNKAAAEVRARISSLLGESIGDMWVGTFHGLAHRILRVHWREADLPQDFTIIDSGDQYRTIRRVLKLLEIDEKRLSPKYAQHAINRHKENGCRPQHIDDQDNRQLYRVYTAYEEICRRSGVVDFTELLLRVHELLCAHATILQHYQQRFRFVLVDEFQDTNALQYAWLKLLVGKTGTLFAVGDDDQSIYSWRGACSEHMQSFEKDFATATLIKLEQNYRSTANILNAANALIANNVTRLGKDLWTQNGDGDKVAIYPAYNDHDEAQYVVAQIAKWRREQGDYQDCAVLYRVSAQSRIIEKYLIDAGIPYRIYGGMRFYERAEIKAILAYLRLAAFKDDDGSFERIINTPPRGIGERTLMALRDLAKSNHCTLWQATQRIVSTGKLSGRAKNALNAFINLISRMAALDESPLDELITKVFDLSGLREHYQKDKGELGLARIENIEELINAAGEPNQNDDDQENMTPLQTFLAYTALESGEMQVAEYNDCVNLMTLHAAKGLEFPNVHLVGVEEGLFPHQLSSDDPVKLEEERRLCYVGITRAKQALTMSYTQYRRLHGKDFNSKPSRFLKELPATAINEVRKGVISHDAFKRRIVFNEIVREPPTTAAASPITCYTLGQHVTHAKFGNGVILKIEGAGDDLRLHVMFKNVGDKWLVASYARLETHPTE